MAGSAGARVARGPIARLRGRARLLRLDAHALWLTARDPRMPRGPRLLALALTAYALSPIDLIPDFVPVLGLLDDLLIVPLGLWLVLRLAPLSLVGECRERAAIATARPASRAAALAIVLLWALGTLVLIALLAAALVAALLLAWRLRRAGRARRRDG